VIEAARRISGNVGETFMSISSAVSPGHATDKDVSCAVAHNAFLGEGPLWLARDKALLWVDILAPAVHVSEIASGRTRSITLGELVGAVVPRRRGGYVAATQGGFRSLDLSTGEMATLATPAGMTGHRFNDAKCDSAGRLWVGTRDLHVKEPNGGLFCIHADFSMHRHGSDLVVSNGIAWAESGRVMYHVDSHPGRIDAYDFDASAGTLSNRRVFRDYVKERAAAIPDGCTIDAEGGLWVAEVGNWHICRYTPDGRLDREIRMPFQKPTSVMFGGADLATLYVTSMRFGLTDAALGDQPLAGSLLQLDVGVKGKPENVFGG